MSAKQPEPKKRFTIQEASYHRNGTFGDGFWAIRFRWTPPDTKQEENFIATIFEHSGGCAVLSLDRMETHGVAFGRGNSWRGDEFEPALRAEIDTGDWWTVKAEEA
jgi:hypothetical protein